MESNDQIRGFGRFVFVNGERVQVTEEVYQTIRAQNNHERWKMRCENRCTLVKYAECRGDCQHCRCHTTGKITSLDALNAEKMSFMDAQIDIEADFIRRETWQFIYQCADEVIDRGAAILRLYVENDYSFHEISEALGIPYSTIRWRINRILRELRAHKENIL